MFFIAFCKSGNNPGKGPANLASNSDRLLMPGINSKSKFNLFLVVVAPDIFTPLLNSVKSLIKLSISDCNCVAAFLLAFSWSW